MKQGLLPVVERRADGKLARATQPEPVADEAEVAFRRQRCRHEDRRRPSLPERVAQPPRDVHGRPAERARLRPDDAVELVGVEACERVGGPHAGASGQEIELVVHARERPRELGHPVRQLAALDERRLPEATASRSRRHRADERSTRPPHAIERLHGDRHARLEAGPPHVPLQPAQSVDGHAAAEPRGRRVLEAVRLVEDDGVVLGEDGGVRLLTQAEVGEVERVVDDDEVRSACLAPSGLREARRGERAPAAEAAVGADRELAPERVRGLERKLGPVARLRLVEPRAQELEGCRVLLSLQQLAAEQLEAVQRLAAEVVVAALEHRHLHFAAEHCCGDGNVLREQLLLERLRRRRHDHAATGGERRDEVREALAGARARFGKQMRARVERVGDGLGELGLLRARLVARQDLRERASGSEHGVHAASVWRAAAVAGKART